MMPRVVSDADSSNPKRTPALIPARIGPYEVQRVLGAGGMATVYAALQKQPRRTVAVKVMRIAANADVALRRFRREIEILGRLRHPYIAQVYEAGVHDEPGGAVPYFVMEYVPGARTILEFAEVKSLSLRNRLKLFVRVCAAVEHGHLNKIVHRDLKPGNILIDERGDPKVIDFGVARAIEVGGADQAPKTEHGRLIGTLLSMAPEQLETKEVDIDARCDVYALGVLLYRLLTGQPPHDLKGLPLHVAAQIIREEPVPPPSRIRADLAGDLDAIVLKALAKDRAQRYRNAGNLGRDVVRHLSNRPVKASGTAPIRRIRLLCRRHRTTFIASAIVLVVIAAAAAVITWQSRTPATPPVVGDVDPGGATATATATPEGVAVATPPDAPATPARESFFLEGQSPAIVAIAFGPDGRQLASASEDRSVVVWHLGKREPVFSTADHDAPPRHLRFSRDGARLLTVADDDTAYVLYTHDGGVNEVIRHHHGPVLTAAIGAHGDVVALAFEDLTLRLFAPVEVHTLRTTGGAFYAAAFDSDGARGRVVGGSDSGDVGIWDVHSGDLVTRLRGLDERVIGVTFIDGDTRVAAVTAAGTGRVWTLADPDGRPDTFSAGADSITTVAFDPSGRWMMCGSGSRIGIFDLQSETRLGAWLTPGANAESLEPPPPPIAPAIGPGARWYASARSDGAIRVAPVE